MKRFAIGKIDRENRERLGQLPEYYQVYANIKGASDEKKGSTTVYNLIHEKFPEAKIGMSLYGFATQKEAHECKSAIKDIARSKGFEAIVTISRVTKVEITEGS